MAGDWALLKESLMILLEGMAGIFIVTLIIMGAMLLLNRFASQDGE